MKYLNLDVGLSLFYIWCILYQYASVQVLYVQSLVTHFNDVHNFQIVGIFSNSLSYNTTSQQCHLYSLRDVQLTQAMIYGIQRLINNDSKLLPGINLGWTIIDSCSSREVATANLASSLLSNKQQSLISKVYLNRSSTTSNGYLHISNSTVSKSDVNPIIGVIGEKSDLITSALAAFTSSLRYSQIGFESYSSILDNRQLYPYFYRPSAPTSTQTQTFDNLFELFNWNMVPVVLAGNIEISNILPIVISSHRSSYMCFHPIVKLYDNYTTTDLTDVILQLKSLTKPHTVSLFGRATIIYNLLKQAEIHNLTGITYIGGYNWLSLPQIYTIRADIIGGAIGIAFNSSSLEYFSDHLNQLDFCNNKDNPWFIEAWRHKLLQAGLDVEFILRNCKIDNKLKRQYFSEFYSIDFSSALVIDSTLAFAYTLRDALGCNSSICLLQSYNFDRDNFNRILSKIKFAGVTSSNVTYQADGSINLSFDIINLQEDTSSLRRNVKPVKIGYWTDESGLVIEQDKIIWNGNRNWFDAPSSRCSQDCPAGFYQYKDATIAINLRSCCWKCRKCPTNQISNTTNSQQCTLCPSFSSSNLNSTSCIDFPIVYAKSDSPLSIAIIITASFHFICLACIWIIMIKKRNTPIVKGSNFILVNLLLFFIGMCIPTAILYLLPTSVMVCQARIFTATIAQVGIYLTILCKTNQVSIIFKNAMIRKKKLTCLTKSFNQLILIFIILAIICSILMCLTILLPIKVNRQPTIHQEIQLICYVPNGYNVISSAVWLGVIGLLCLILAFKARSLPENFNESRYIFMSSLFIAIINLCSLPGTIALSGIIADGINALMVLIFGMSPMLCLFVPKIYIIYYRPELNTKQEAMASITNFTFNNVNHSKHRYNTADMHSTSTQATICRDLLSTTNQVHPSHSH